MESGPGEVTQLLLELKGGNKDAEAQLIPLVYTELRRIAGAHLRRENRNHSLQPTALVHEAYLRLARIQSMDWQSRAHFFAVAATFMRRILVDHARASRADKRGAGAPMISLEDAHLPTTSSPVDVLAVDQALTRLAAIDERQAKVVELRFFGGLNEEETGLVLGVSSRTVKRDWRVARAWLFDELSQ